MRTTTDTAWANQHVTTTRWYSDATWDTTSILSRIITGTQVFTEPVINPARPGWTITQTVPATGTVTTPNQATSTTADACGLGGSIASCQTPSTGTIACAGLNATAQICLPTQPTPGRPGGTQANLPHHHTDNPTHRHTGPSTRRRRSRRRGWIAATPRLSWRMLAGTR